MSTCPSKAYVMITSLPIPPKWIPAAGYADYRSGGKRPRTPAPDVRAEPALSSLGRLDRLSSAARYVLEASLRKGCLRALTPTESMAPQGQGGQSVFPTA